MANETTNGSWSGHPETYDEVDYSYYTANNLSRGLADHKSTNYALINVTRGTLAESWFYYKFDTSAIPQNAVIDSITCTIKGITNTVNANLLATHEIWLCSGTQTKGEPFVTTTSTVARNIPNCGSWTRAELNDLRLKLYAVRGPSATQGYYFHFYGATVSIEYHTVNAAIRIKSGGGWLPVAKAFRKINGDWVEQTIEDTQEYLKSNIVFYGGNIHDNE